MDLRGRKVKSVIKCSVFLSDSEVKLGKEIVDMCGEESVVVNLLSSDVKSNMTGQCYSAYQ